MSNENQINIGGAEPRTSTIETLEVDQASKDMLEGILYDIDNHLEVEINRIRDSQVSSLIQWAYVATVGTGKTYALTRAAGKAVEKGWRVAIRVPTTKHAHETKTEIDKISPGSTGIWLGREQENPNDPTVKMCPRAAEVVAAQSVGGGPKHVCGSKRRGYCKFHPEVNSEGCGYKQQNLSQKQIIIFAGDSMLEFVPRDPMRQKGREQGFEFDLIMLDEFDPQGLIHSGSGNIDLDCLEATSIKLSDDSQIQDILVMFLQEIHAQVLSQKRYLAPQSYERPPEDFTIEQLLELSAASACSSKTVSASQRPDSATKNEVPIDKQTTFETLDGVLEAAKAAVPLTIGKDQFRSMSAAQIYETNKAQYKIRRIVLNIAKTCELMIQAVARDITELKHLEVLPESKAISINYLKAINLQYFFPPVLVFDATLQYELAKCILPNLEIRMQKHVSDGTGVKRFQLTDTSLSYSTLSSSSKWPARLRLWSEICHTMFGQTGLLLPKFLRSDIEPNLREGIMLGHFGDLKGTNNFQHVDALIVASRPAVNPRQAERAAAIITWENIQSLEEQYDWYPREEAPILYRHNRAYSWSVWHDKHPDRFAEAVRHSITEASIEQAAGRGRSTRRSATEPLTEYLLTSVPTNRPVDGVFSVAQLKAATSWIGVLLQEGLWLPLATKGAGDLLHRFLLALKSQRPKTLYSTLIGLPAFESPNNAAAWRKKQIQDNFEISRLAQAVDDALQEGAPTVEMLCSPFPLKDFQPIRAKVRGARYFAQVYVRVNDNESLEEALRRILGDEMGHIEVKPK